MKGKRESRRLYVSILACTAVLFCTGNSYALYMTEMSDDLQTTTTAPSLRYLSLKLPLEQPRFHWTFLNRNDFLAGRLVLRITRDHKTEEITVFQSGTISEGWEVMPLPEGEGRGEIYFGFLSSKQYLTAPRDSLELELQVSKDLAGIGALQKGVLPAGTYKAKGSYSGLIDHFKVSPMLRDKLTAEQRQKVLSLYENKAFLENWKSQWALRITENRGWLSEEQRKHYEQLIEQLESQEKE